jgi:hypothetical protein
MTFQLVASTNCAPVLRPSCLRKTHYGVTDIKRISKGHKALAFHAIEIPLFQLIPLTLTPS